MNLKLVCWAKVRQQKEILYDSIYMNLWKKPNLTCSDRKKISGFLGLEEVLTVKEHKENLEDDENIPFLDCGGVYTGMFIC